MGSKHFFWALGVFVIFFSMNVLAAPTVYFYFDTTTTEDITKVDGNIYHASSVIFQIKTDQAATCKYSENSNTPYSAMNGEFDFSSEILHNKYLLEIEDGVYHYYVRCKNDQGVESEELEAVFSVITPITAEIDLSEDTPLGEGIVEVSLKTSKVVQGIPSLEYSFDSVDYDPIPLTGSDTSWTGYLIIPSSIGETVGSFRFKATDLEGVDGSEITDGSVFLIDTKKPDTIINLQAVGYKGRIQLDWYLDDDYDVSFYNIYRSTSQSVSFADFYKEVDDISFSDTLVDTGTTYHYRIVAVDEAGNEGDLSIEVFATPLLDDVNDSANGLPLELHSFVDNELSLIDLVMQDIDAVADSLNSKSGVEQEVISALALDKEISSARSELSSLRTDIERSKTQQLSRVELDKKLESSSLRINTIKKKVPESVVVIESRELVQDFSPEDLRTFILETTLDFIEESDEKRIDYSIMAAETYGFSVTTRAHTLELVYLDGGREDLTLFKEEIDSSIGFNESISIVEVIPKDIAESTAVIDVKTAQYTVLEEDPVLSFSSDTTEILYSVQGHINLNTLSGIKTFLLHEPIQEIDTGFDFTGFATFTDVSSGGYFGVIVGVLIAAALAGYLFVMKRQSQQARLKPLFTLLEKASEALKNQNLESAKTHYDSLSAAYTKLDPAEKKKIYEQLVEFNKAFKDANRGVS